SSREALTSSKRGSEKDRDIEPEKSSIGESSSRTSSSPPTSPPSPRAAARSRHSGVPTSQAKDSVCRSRSPGTSSGSRSFAKDTRNGAPGIPPETRSEEHTSELQSRENLVCRLLLEKKNKYQIVSI